MLINSVPINSGELNSVGAAGAAPEPQPIVPGSAFSWRVLVQVAGVDVTSRLTGEVSIDRERGAAGIATFTLQLISGAVIPMAWVGRPVTIDFISTALGLTTESRRYAGRIVTNEWDPLMRLMVCHCGDQLQQRIEQMSVLDIEGMIPSFWSSDVYEDPEGRSRWDYAQERLASVQVSLDSSPYDDLRLTSWYAGGYDFEFGPGSTVYQSVKFSYADLTSLTNKVEIEANYRFSRLRQLNTYYYWKHPETGSVGGTSGFCLWRSQSSELPDIAMIKDAASGAGLSIVKTPAYFRLPPSAADPCGNGVSWRNSYPDLLLGVGFDGGMRWTQAVTEKYTMTVVAEQSIAQAGEVIARESLSIEYTTDFGEKWEGKAFGIDAPRDFIPSNNPLIPGGTLLPIDGGISGHRDERDEGQRQTAFRCLLNQAKTTVILAHTATQVSWDVPTSMVMEVDLIHTLYLNDQGVKAGARCSRVYDRFDLGTGSALTTLTVSVMRGGGAVSDPLNPPAFSVEAQPEPVPPSPISLSLPTQLGRRRSSGTYKEELDGFSGNYDASDNPLLEAFPRRFQVTAPEVPETKRDEKTVPLTGTYRIAIPNDELEL